VHIPVRAANPSSAAQLPKHMSKHTVADPARSAPQPAPQTIRAAGAACAVAMQTPAGTERRAARMLPNIDRGKWGQHLIPYTLGLYVTCVSPNSSLMVAAMCRLGNAFGRERVLDDDGALRSGSYFPLSSSAAAGTSAGLSPSVAATFSASTDRRSYSEPQRKI
jgi:hypothetical protein